MDERILKDEARLYALEYMVMNLYATLHRSAGSTLEDVQALHVKKRRSLAEETFPGFDAAESDLVAQEIQSAVKKLLGGIEEIMAMGKK